MGSNPTIRGTFDPISWIVPGTEPGSDRRVERAGKDCPAAAAYGRRWVTRLRVAGLAWVGFGIMGGDSGAEEPVTIGNRPNSFRDLRETVRL